MVNVDVHVLGNTKLSLVRQIRKLLRLTLLVFGLGDVFVQVGLKAGEQVCSVLDCALEHLRKRQRRMLSHRVDVVAQVRNPNIAQLLILGCRLVWEGCNEGATRDTGRIPDRPALVLKAVDEGL